MTLAGGHIDPLPLGSSLLLSWNGAAGRAELPVVLTDLPALRVPVWRLAPAPTSLPPQRRASVRAPAFLRVELRRGTDRWSAGLFALLAATTRWRFGPLGVAVTLLVAYAITSEVVQALVLADRSGDPLDVVADLLGVAAGWLVARRLLP